MDTQSTKFTSKLMISLLCLIGTSLILPFVHAGRRNPSVLAHGRHHHLFTKRSTPFLHRPPTLDALPNHHQQHESILLSLRGGARNKSSKQEQQTTVDLPIPSSEPLQYNQTSTKIASVPISTIYQSLQTNPSLGLTDEQATNRLDIYGYNQLKMARGKNLFTLIMEQFDDKLVQILLVVAVISGIFSYYEHQQHVHDIIGKTSLLQSFVEPIVILAILVLNAIVGVWQSKSAEGSIEALKKLQPSLCTVLRNGIWMDNMDSSQLVPGDIIKFRVGDRISADARVVSMDSSTLMLDEGSLTGESVTVEKLPGDEGLCEDEDAPVQDMQSVVFSGTVCTAGSASAVVMRTGMATEIGKIQKVYK
jgi:magnesium-transporting ATPase (P-type)